MPLFGLKRRDSLDLPPSTLSVCFTLAIAVLYGVAPAVTVQAIAGFSKQRYHKSLTLYLRSIRVLTNIYIVNKLF